MDGNPLDLLRAASIAPPTLRPGRMTPKDEKTRYLQRRLCRSAEDLLITG
jgi:hypothetical protein